MPTAHRPHRHVTSGAPYTGGIPYRPETTRPLSSGRGEFRLTTSPEDLGIIGAELAKRLTMAAEDFLTELAADQVRGAFRHELGGIVEEEPEE